MVPLVMIVPSGEEYGDIEKFVRPFSLSTWMAIFVTIMLAFVVMVIISHYSQSIFNFVVGKNVKTPMFNNLSVVFGVSQTQLPKRNFARFILMVYILWCLIIRSAYQGGIFKILKSNERKPQLASITEMLDKNYVFYLYETLAPRMQSFKLYERHVLFPNVEIHKYRLKTLDPSFKGVVFSYQDQILYQNTLNYKNYTMKICKQTFLTAPFVFYFRKSHYLVEEVSANIEQMLTGGIIQKIRATYADPKFFQRDKDIAEQKTLTLANFAGAFQIFMMWIVIAGSFFVFEMMTNIKKLSFIKKAMDYAHYRLS